jgi:hypothetical protein
MQRPGLMRFFAVTACLSLASCASEEERSGMSIVSETASGATRIDTVQWGSGPDTKFSTVHGNSLRATLPQRTIFVRRVDGVFMGISNFGAQANRVPTPAHTIGAAYAYSMFHQIDERSKEFFRNKPLSPGTNALKFMGHLRLDPKDPAWNASRVAAALGQLPGVHVFDYSKVFDLPPDGLWDYVRSNTAFTKANILAAARAQAARVMAVEGDERPPLAIFYLATHGAVGPDGRRYAMAADSIEGDLSTWISYQELAAAFEMPFDMSRAVAAMMIVDTCLTGEFTESEEIRDVPPEGVVLLAAAAPGQYSWHWTEASEIRLLEGSVGSGLFQRKLEPRDLSYYSTMSVLPFAAAHTLKVVENDMDEDCEGAAHEAVVVVTSVHFIKWIVDRVPELASSARGKTERVQTAESLAGKVTSGTVQFDLEQFPERFALFGVPCVSRR